MSKPIINRLRRISGRTKVLISATTTNLSMHRNGGGLINRTTIAGAQTLNLPAATGKQSTIRIEIGVTATGNKVIKAAGTDVMEGVAAVAGTTSGSFPTASNTNTITMTGTTTGGILGSIVELIDVAVGKWQLQANLVGSGTVVTPLSNT